jgi:HAE1 family hydrophobic/amphiphilic exporter-1
VKQSVATCSSRWILTLVLVVLVIFLFLRNVSSTIIPSLALPLSILGTFIVMQGLGYSLDNLSLMALDARRRFVVDDAIVVLENIVRHMEMGKPPLRASIDGAKEIGFTVVSMTISLSAVFIPILFMGGIMGRLFHEFAVVMGSAGADLRVHLALADAHAREPVPEAARETQHGPSSTNHAKRGSRSPSRGTTPGSPGRFAHRG